MPELPEVETVLRGLVPALQGRRIETLTLRRADLRTPMDPALPHSFRNVQIVQMFRRGKYILIFAETGAAMVLHLGMSGRVRIEDNPANLAPLGPHDHVVIERGGGGRIVYTDPRRFGQLLLTDAENWPSLPTFAAMGPEPLGNAFNAEILERSLRGRKGLVKTLLLDQKIIAGLGNIYVCEALYQAGIHPADTGDSIRAARAEALCAAIRDVLNRAIEAGGSSLRDHRQTDGSLGYFQHGFSVYDKEGRACPDCDCNPADRGGVVRIVQAGRSSFYCPQKQKQQRQRGKK